MNVEQAQPRGIVCMCPPSITVLPCHLILHESVEVQIGGNNNSSLETFSQTDSLYYEFLHSESYAVTIANPYGMQVYSETQYAKHFTIPTANIPEGIYLIEIRTRLAKSAKSL